ncbi:hypothetical protein [Massilibacterium senegalense]|uniref:hypothetical protein n=1 Tax=Massilibacterium senegalense TaxID=1632858 RepID=UPI0007808E0D|nr:hypothetical protein [Massilibacterium senegalense]
MIGEVFVFLRPIAYVLLILLIFNFTYLLFFQQKMKPDMYIITNSLILTIISALLLFQEGIIVDELALDGDAVTFYIVAFTVIVFFVGLVVYLFKTSKH